MAILLPTAITTFSATPTQTFHHAEVADEDPADEIIGAVANLPVIAGSSVVDVDGVPCADPACYTVVIATGVYTVATAFVADGQTVNVTYQSVQDFTGIVGTVWDNLPVFVALGGLLLLAGSFGILKATKGGKGGGGGGLGEI